MSPKIAQNFHRIFTSTKLLAIANPVPALFGTAGLILFVLGLISLLGTGQPREQIIFEEPSEVLGNRTVQEIVIDVEGAVVRPGVYKIAGQSRIKDALIAASGLSENADRDWVAKNLNLAQKLTDGAKVYVPKVGEGAKSATTTTGNININTASLSELEGLPGVGKVTAQKIIDGRQYTAIEELLEKKIVGNAVFEKIKEKIAVY